MHIGTDRVTATKDGPTGWLVFNNPVKHNAISLEMWQAIPTILRAFAADSTIRVVVVTGAGDRAFTSGADISEFAEKRATPGAVHEYDALSERAALALEELNLPTIAMIRGYCIGGGLDIALRCDLRLAAEDARFRIPAARLGIGYSFGDVKRLIDIVGQAYAKEIFLTGRQFSAAEAHQMGLVHRVVSSGSLDNTLREYIGIIAANAPLTIRAMKKCIQEAMKDQNLREMAECESAIEACFDSGDYVEGRTAFVENRLPVFRGR